MEHRPSSPIIGGTDSPTESPRRVESAQILQGRQSIEIVHGNQRYVLRVTRENKLILTK